VSFAPRLNVRARQVTGLVAGGDTASEEGGIVVDEARAVELYDLAMKGDIKELLARADSASAGDPAAAPVYQEVQRLARRFDFKGIRRVLDLAREKNS